MRITFFLIAFIVTGYSKCFAQTNSEEAQLTYKLAMEAYDKGDYTTCSNYLNNVIKLDTNSKPKVAYMQVKCIEPSLFVENYDDSKFQNALNWIKVYLNVGADESKRRELITLKIKIESNPEYKAYKEIEGYSKEQIKAKILESISFKAYSKQMDDILYKSGRRDYQRLIYDTAYFKNEHILMVALCSDNWTAGTNVNPGIFMFYIYSIDLKNEKTFNGTGSVYGEFFHTYYSKAKKKQIKKFKKWHEADVEAYPNITYDHFEHAPEVSKQAFFNYSSFINNSDKNLTKQLYRYFVRMGELCR